MQASDTEFSDEELTEILERHSGNLTAAATECWLIKAADFAPMIDRNESGTEIPLSDKFKHALAMAEHYSKISGVTLEAVQASYRAYARVASLDESSGASTGLLGGSRSVVYERMYALKRFMPQWAVLG